MSKPMPLTENDFQHAAVRLGVRVAAIKAVYAVESSGSGFLPDGRVKVNYEPHIMYRQLKKKFGEAYANGQLARHPDLVAKKPGHLVPQNLEHEALDRAVKEIDRECGLESASWGAPQIMGFHWKALGFATVQLFVNRMFQGEAGQLDVFCRFIEIDPRLHRAMKALDWKTFADIYNGPAHQGYDAKISREYDRASR